MADVNQIGTLVSFTPDTTIASADVNQNYADIKAAFNNLVTATNTLQIDTVQEKTPDGGVEVDGLSIQDGAIPTSGVPNLDTAKITTGVFADARIPDLDAAKITTGAFDTARIPSLDGSKITTGTLGTTVQDNITRLGTLTVDLVMAAAKKLDLIATGATEPFMQVEKTGTVVTADPTTDAPDQWINYKDELGNNLYLAGYTVDGT